MKLKELFNSLKIKTLRTILKLLFWTCRFEVRDRANFPEMSEKGGFILTMWHNQIAMVEPFLARFGSLGSIYTAVISHSRDGNLMAGIVGAHSCTKIVRMPRGNRHLALRQMIRSLASKEIIVLAADGSTGPIYKAKPGIPFTARSAEAPIVPISIFPSHCWRLRTWDRMMIPKPFSKITISIGEPFQVKGTEEDHSKEEAVKLTEALLDADAHAIR